MLLNESFDGNLVFFSHLFNLSDFALNIEFTGLLILDNILANCLNRCSNFSPCRLSRILLLNLVSLQLSLQIGLLLALFLLDSYDASIEFINLLLLPRIYLALGRSVAYGGPL